MADFSIYYRLVESSILATILLFLELLPLPLGTGEHFVFLFGQAQFQKFSLVESELVERRYRRLEAVNVNSNYHKNRVLVSV
jgi:hypothetical protein